MKKYIERTRRPEIERICIEVECDLCHKTSKTLWTNGSFDATATEIIMKTGSSYPEGGSGTETEIDICPTCFVEKLIPWVETHGGTPTTKEWEW